MEIKHSTALRLAVGLVLASTFLLWPTGGKEAIIEPEPVIEVLPPVQEIKTPDPIQPIPAVNDELKKIAWCESKNRQFNADGSVHRGKINPQDVGKYQINEYYHLEESKRLGMDIYTLAGNTEYANYLYATQGNTPWNWSKECWADPDREWSEKAGEYWSK